MITATGVPPQLSAELVRVLRMSKREFLEYGQSAAGQTIVQTGAACVGELTLTVQSPRRVTDTLIETFVVDPSGACDPTGDADDLNALWLPLVTSMAGQVGAALAAHEVRIGGPAYVTASLTPVGEVNGDAHIDDDQYLPDDGVGVVAIVSSGAGPRVATAPLPTGPVRSGLPLDVQPALFDDFAGGRIPYQQTDGRHIVLFPQFGQLHSGPGPTDGAEPGVRNLLVYRAATIPAA